MKKIFSLFAAILVAGSMWGTQYELVTSTNQLVAGCNYLIVYETGTTYYVNAGVSGDYIGTVTATKTDGKINAPDGCQPLVLGGNSDGWTLRLGASGQYIYYSGSGTKLTSNANVSNNTKWTISINASNNAAITNVATNARLIRSYVSGSTCTLRGYTSSNGNAVKLYKEMGGDPDPEPTKYTITISNSIANGKVTASASSAAAGTTITLTPKPDTGYELDSWSVTNASTSAAITVTSNKFTMPAANVNVSATFVATSTDPVVYSTGFESNEGFTASTSYYSEVSQGPASLQWTIYGSATTNEKNTGNQCIQMRISTSMNPSAVDAVYPYAFTNFTLPYVTAVEFYDRVSDNACIKKYKVQYSLNNGTSWNDAKEISAGSNSWAKKTVNIPEQSATMKIRFVISEYEKPSSTQKLSIDDVKIQTSAGKNVSIGSALYATLYLDYDVIIPENVSAYTATVEDGAFSLNAITGDKIKSNTAVVLKATTADDYNFVATVGATNMNSTLKGAATAMTAAEMAEANPDMGKFYALSLNAEGKEVGFYWINEGGAAFGISAGKAYLALPASSGAPARFIFGQQDVPTEVVNVNDNNQSTKVLRDGRLYILRDGNLFDLNGRLVK